MRDAVIIKSFQNGISINLADKVPFDELLKEIGYKFKETSKFFGNAKMALSIEGRFVTEEEEYAILEAIQQNSKVEIVCIVGKDEEKNKEMYYAMQEAKGFDNTQCNGQFYKGTLKNSQVLETESSIVVIGDVHAGSAIISTKDIIILGSLYGQAYAGGSGDPDHFIVALEMAPEKLKIGDFKYKPKSNKSKWGVKPKVQPKIAYVEDGKVVLEPITKELLDVLY